MNFEDDTTHDVVAPLREQTAPVKAAARGLRHRVCADETAHWAHGNYRFKRNGGRKGKTLRSHRNGR